MLKKLTLALLLFTLGFSISLKADEGMWIPLLLKKYNIADMQKHGFKLTAEDIYSINNVSMKDAIVRFGGCTAELISNEGLLITNHHCGYGQIRNHSTVEHDYLTNGFWAMSNEEELSNPGLAVTFLVSIKDVTKEVFSAIKENMENTEKQKLINSSITKIRNEAVKGTHYTSRVSSFYNGNQYYLFVYEVYRDVRLVGAPPSSIGKFGGDTDNWMWPRHTGDFSLFRIYADKNNKPAEYSPDNVPFKPKKYFPVSTAGVKEGDFTMVFGYPGRTTEYLPSFSIEMRLNQSNPHMINLREKRINIMKADMNTSPAIRIQYASKVAGIANGWKKSIGQSMGLKRFNAVEKKKSFEKKFTEWVNQDNSRKMKYGHLLPEYERIYKELAPYNLASVYSREAGNASEIIGFAARFRNLIRLSEQDSDDERIQNEINRLKRSASSFFKDYNQSTDKNIFNELFKIYYQNITDEFRPDIFEFVENMYDADFDKYTEFVYEKSIFGDANKLELFLNRYNKSMVEQLKNDPAYLISLSLSKLNSEKITPFINKLSDEQISLNRDYMTAQMEFQKNKLFYPDANSTLRLTYGNVKGFFPHDAVYYTYYTTLKGIMEKDNPDIYDYDVPDKLKELYFKKDYGIYGENGEMHVCFIASNHTSGGNSGSPVINAYGHLIGVNFDRNWEGTMSDIMYDPDHCRNISIDIRYALFLIDKFAGAKHIIEELTLVE